jgi:hypothetical protein
MRTFEDKTGHKWHIDLTIGAVTRVKQASEGRFDLFDAGKNNLAETLWTDLEMFWELLWLLVEPEAQALDPPIDAAQFGDAMAAACLINARQAFYAEWQDFFQTLQRPDQALPLEKLKTYMDQALTAMREKANDPALTKIDLKVKAKIDSQLNSSFGKLLAELDATLALTPSASSGGKPSGADATSSSKRPSSGRSPAVKPLGRGR